MVKISAGICISSRTLCSELSLKIKHLPKWVYHVLPLHWRFASCETADPGLQCSVVHIVTQCAMVKKGKSGLAGTRQVGLDAGIQGWSHCRTVYLPSSRAGVIGRKDECDGFQLKVPFLQTSSSSKEETAMGGRQCKGAVAPKAMGWMESV